MAEVCRSQRKGAIGVHSDVLVRVIRTLIREDEPSSGIVGGYWRRQPVNVIVIYYTFNFLEEPYRAQRIT